MKTLTQKQTSPIAPGILLVLMVLACLRAMPILAQESSLLLPKRQPSELLLPALEEALFQPTKSSSSFLKSQSFEVREAAKRHKSGNDNAPRRLKSAVSATKEQQANSAKTETPFPTVGALPQTMQKPVAGQNMPGQNVTAFKEVLQYDSTGLFALKLVQVPVLSEAQDGQPVPVSQGVNLPPFLVSSGKTAMPAVSSDAAPVNKKLQSAKASALPAADSSDQKRREGAALAAIGAVPKSAAMVQKTGLPAGNPLLVLPPNHPSSTEAKTALAADQSQVKKIQPQTEISSKGAPVPALKSGSFDLGSTAMEYVSGGSIPDGKSGDTSDKPIPVLDSGKESPWFTRLPKDDFLIGFDNEEEIGRAQSQVFLGPNGEVRDLPPQTRYVPLPTAGMTLPEEMQVAEPAEQSPTTASASQPELAASLPASSSAEHQMIPTAVPVSLPSAPQEAESVVDDPQPEKTDFLAKLSFGKIKMGSKTGKTEKLSERKVTDRRVKRAEKESPVRRSEYGATDAPSGKSVTSLFSGMNPFSKKKTR